MAVNYAIGATFYTALASGTQLSTPAPSVGPSTDNGDASGLGLATQVGWTPTSPPTNNFTTGDSVDLGIDLGGKLGMGNPGGGATDYVDQIIFRIAAGLSWSAGSFNRIKTYSATAISGGVFTGLSEISGEGSIVVNSSADTNGTILIPVGSGFAYRRYFVIRFAYGGSTDVDPTGTLTISHLFVGHKLSKPVSTSAWPTFTAPPRVITSSTPVNGYLDEEFSYQIETDGTPNFYGELSGDPLPDGLSLNTSTGLITGTPTTVENQTPGLFATWQDSDGDNVWSDDASVVIANGLIEFDILAGAAPVINSPSTAYGRVGHYFSFGLTALHFPTSWSVDELPDGLTLNTSTGLIDGSPTQQSSHFDVNVTASNSYGDGVQLLNIIVYPLEDPQTPTTMTELVAAQEAEKSPIVEAEPGARVEPFEPTPDKPNTWQASFVHGEIESVHQDGEALEPADSVDDVDATPGSYYYNHPTRTVYIHPPDGLDPNPHIVVAGFKMYFIEGWPGRIPKNFDGNQYLLYLAKDGIPRVRNALQDTFFGGMTSSVGDINLINQTGFFDQIAAQFRWEARTVTLSLGGGNLPRSQYTDLCKAIVYQTKWSEKRFTLSCRSPIELLKTCFPASRKLTTFDISAAYTFTHEIISTQAAEPPASPVQYTRMGTLFAPYTRTPLQVDANALATAPIGATVPLLLGTCYAVQGVLLAQSQRERMVMLSSQSIQGLLDVVNGQGARASQAYHTHGASTHMSDGIYTSEVRIDLENAVVLETFRTQLHDIQSAPYVTAPWFLNADAGPYSYDVYGATNDDGTLCENPSDVIAKALEAAEVPLEMDASTFAEAAVEADLYPVSLPITDGGSAILDAIGDLLRAIGGYLYTNLQGALVLAIPAPSLDAVITLVDETGDIDEIGVSGDTRQVATSISCAYPAPVAGGVSVAAAAIPQVEAIAFKLIASSYSYNVPLATVGAATLSATNMMRRRLKPMNPCTVQTGMKVCGLNLLDVVKIQRTRIPAQALPYLIGRAMSIEIDSNTNNNTIVINDNEVFLEFPWQGFFGPDDTDLEWDDATEQERIEGGWWHDDDGFVVSADSTTKKKSVYR